MNPQIRYCTTSDGVRIAYWTMGFGPPLLHAPPGPSFGHIAAELGLDDIRAWYERMARTHTLIRFDPRGCGASGRDGRVSLETLALDFEAVCDALELKGFALFAEGTWVPAAITFAARATQRVAQLILWGGFARSSDRGNDDRLLATRTLIDQNWVGYTNAWAQTAFGWAQAGQARVWARLFSEATTPEHHRRFISIVDEADVTELLAAVSAPTLVVRHRRGKFSPPAEASQLLAARLSNARLVMLDGQGYPFTQPDRVEENARLIDEFTGVPVPDTSISDARSAQTERHKAASGTAIVLFTDIADSTALTERMGDAAFREASRATDDRVRTTIRKHGGSPVEGKVLGDGVMGVFSSAAQAIDAARECVELSANVGADGRPPLPLHIGLHAGDVLREADNVYGGAVNIASRICGLCVPGEILVSATIRELARTSAGVTFEDRGEHQLKGIEDPVRVYAVTS